MWHLEHDNYYNYFSFSLSLSLFLSNRYKKGDCLSFSRERLSLSLSTSFFLFHLSFAFSLLFDDQFFFLNDKKKRRVYRMKRARPSDPRGQSACANIITKREKKKKQKEKKKHVAEIGVDFTLIYLPRSSSIPFTTEYKIFSVAVLTTQGVVTYTLRWKNRIDEIRFCARSFIKCARQLRKKIPSLSLDCCSTSPIFFYRILDSNLLRH